MTDIIIPETVIRNMLLDEDSIVTAIPGGIYSWSVDTGQNGISRDTTPNAYDPNNHFLRVCAVVKERDIMLGVMGLKGNEKFAGTNQVIEIYLYDELDWNNLYIVKDLVSNRLQRTYVGEFGRLLYRTVVKTRDPQLSEAALLRLEFDMPGVFYPPSADDDDY